MTLRVVGLQAFAVCRRQKTRVGSEKNQRGKIGGLQLSVGEQSRGELNRVSRSKRMSYEKPLRFEQNRVGQLDHFVISFNEREKVAGKFGVFRRRYIRFAPSPIHCA